MRRLAISLPIFVFISTASWANCIEEADFYIKTSGSAASKDARISLINCLLLGNNSEEKSDRVIYDPQTGDMVSVAPSQRPKGSSIVRFSCGNPWSECRGDAIFKDAMIDLKNASPSLFAENFCRDSGFDFPSQELKFNFQFQEHIYE